MAARQTMERATRIAASRDRAAWAVFLAGLAVLITTVSSPVAHAQSTASESTGVAADTRATTSAGLTPAPSPPVPLVYFGDTIATFRVPSAGVSPERRAQIARERLESLRSNEMLWPVRLEPIDQGHMVMLGDRYVFMVRDGDVDPDAGQTGAQLAETVRERLGGSLQARARRLSAGARWRAVLAVVVGTAVVIVLLRILGWVRRRAIVWVESKSQAHRGRLKLGDVDFLDQFSLATSWIVKTAAQLGVLVLAMLWVIFVLNRFPETERWGQAARTSLLDLLRTFEVGLFRAIPGLVAVTVIVLAVRFLSRLTTDIFGGIERGTIRLPGVHPETAGATRRLVIGLIWLFGVVVAYPLVPGSDSDAFKGVSVFLGLIITLGSSGVVGHMMSGLVVVYSRSLKAGDLVRVGDIEGKVAEVGALSVKLMNPKGEEFTIPNTVIVGNTVKNYSRLCRDSGPVLTTSVTIGYNAPWRVVYEMLLGAADRTPGILKVPAPIVYQPSLSDFFVEYQLVVRLDTSANRLVVLSELHQNIQDAFNERGVQIMSPHFEGQPERPIVVPKAKWFAAPGDPAGPGGA